MKHGLLCIWLIPSDAFEDDGIRALAIYLDFALRRAYHSGHPLARGVELANVEDLELLGLALDVNENRLWFPHL